jgi:hypothetical protein
MGQLAYGGRGGEEGKAKAVPMKKNTSSFDDVLWQGKKQNRAGSPKGGGGLSEGDAIEESYTKLIAFSEAVKKISFLVHPFSHLDLQSYYQ